MNLFNYIMSFTIFYECFTDSQLAIVLVKNGFSKYSNTDFNTFTKNHSSIKINRYYSDVYSKSFSIPFYILCKSSKVHFISKQLI